MAATRDALGNVVTVATRDDMGNTENRIDYRVLQPYWVTDPNGNRTRVAFDALVVRFTNNCRVSGLYAQAACLNISEAACAWL
jgi:hypothetical protein